MTAVRFSTAEREVVERKATDAGVSLSEWLRAAALERDPPVRRVIPEINRAAWLELSKLAATLNGAMWRFRPGAEPELRTLFDLVRGELATFRNALIGNYGDDEKGAEK
jgi:hypothetical protein